MDVQNKVGAESKGRGSSFFTRFKCSKASANKSPVEKRQRKEPVVEVTTANFNQIVFDPNQDVLIEFYTNVTLPFSFLTQTV
jgi:thioredoxin-like negative regulator of GroEL